MVKKSNKGIVKIIAPDQTCMKKTTVLLLVFCLSNVLYAQSADDQKAVQQTVTAVFDALSNRNASDLRSNCTADVRFYEYGQTWTVDTLINLAITKNTATDFKRGNKFDFINTTVKGDVAWATYKLQSDINQNGKSVSVYWMETVVLVQENKKWKINVLHSTRLK